MISAVKLLPPVSLTAIQKHYALFFSPVLNRLIVPFAVQTSLFPEIAKNESVGSVCNTHTKVRNPELKDDIKAVN
jgi:hypothetical protein